MRLFRTRIARTIAVCAALAIVLAAWSDVRAGTLPNISGTWYANGDSSKPCRISQSGSSVTLTNERGNTATGTFTDPSTLSTDWGPFAGGHVTGNIGPRLLRINWSNGTYWTRSSAPIPIAPSTPTPTPTPSPTPPPEPLRVSVNIENNNSSPIYVYGASLTNGYGFTYAQCVSFRNVSTKVATAVDFAYGVTNYNGGLEASFAWSNKGTFTPPVNIDDHCFKGQLWPPHVVRRMSHESVRVTQVFFSDGTFWQPGMAFERGYAASGEQLAQPAAQPAVQAPQSTNPVAFSDLVAPGPYRMFTQFTGSGKCLDVVSDGGINRLRMTSCGSSIGQKWWVKKVEQGYIRLKSSSTGPGMCLAVINDGQNDQLRMSACGDYPGQIWWAKKDAQGYLRLRSSLTGAEVCLDIVNDGMNDRLKMAACGDFSGQMWTSER
jgi:hypothetical protein